MSDGLLSIKERKKPEDFVALQKKQQKAEKFNPYRYASPNFVNSSVSIQLCEFTLNKSLLTFLE